MLCLIYRRVLGGVVKGDPEVVREVSIASNQPSYYFEQMQKE